MLTNRYYLLGAEAFLLAEYSLCVITVAGFALVIFAAVSWGQTVQQGFLTSVAFCVGSVTSIACGYIGMRVSVYSSVRTTLNAQKDGFGCCFNAAFRPGNVIGFMVAATGIIAMYVTLLIFTTMFDRDTVGATYAMAGFGLGASLIALFCRVGGGTKY
jgi:Na+/H+-translocating membrane pyrophosphatase